MSEGTDPAKDPAPQPIAGESEARAGQSEARAGDTLAFTLMVFYLMSTLTLALMAVVTSELQDTFGFSASQIGLLTSIFMFAYGAVGIPAGVAAARWGGRVLGISCAFFVLGSLVFGLSSSYAGFMVGRLLQGLGGGMVVPVSSPIIARFLRPEARNRGWGVFASGKGLGALVALLAMPSVAALGGYRAVYMATAGIALVVGAFALAQKPVLAKPIESREETSIRALGRALGTVVVNKRVLLLGLFNAASLAVGTGVLMWTPDFLSAKYGTSAQMAAYLTAGLAIAQTLGAPAGAVGAIRWGRMRVIVGCMVAMSIATALVPVVGTTAGVFIMVMLVGLFSLAYFSPRFAMIPEVVPRPEHVGPASGLINALGFVISMLAPWLFGLALDRGLGYSAGYLLLAAFGVAGVIGAAFFKAPRSQPAAS
jgi:MFS family permease